MTVFSTKMFSKTKLIAFIILLSRTTASEIETFKIETAGPIKGIYLIKPEEVAVVIVNNLYKLKVEKGPPFKIEGPSQVNQIAQPFPGSIYLKNSRVIASEKIGTTLKTVIADFNLHSLTKSPPSNREDRIPAPGMNRGLFYFSVNSFDPDPNTVLRTSYTIHRIDLSTGASTEIRARIHCEKGLEMVFPHTTYENTQKIPFKVAYSKCYHKFYAHDASKKDLPMLPGTSTLDIPHTRHALTIGMMGLIGINYDHAIAPGWCGDQCLIVCTYHQPTEKMINKFTFMEKNSLFVFKWGKHIPETDYALWLKQGEKNPQDYFPVKIDLYQLGCKDLHLKFSKDYVEIDQYMDLEYNVLNFDHETGIGIFSTNVRKRLYAFRLLSVVPTSSDGIGQFLNGGNCSPCSNVDPKCSTCNSATKCTRCLGDLILSPDGRSCQCPAGTYQKDQQCLSCPDSATLKATNDGCDCPEGSYFKKSSNECIPCKNEPGTDGSCIKCELDSSNLFMCLDCESGYSLHADKRTCRAICKENEAWMSYNTCSQCPSPCSTCLNETKKCKTCAEGFVQSALDSTVCEPKIAQPNKDTPQTQPTVQQSSIPENSIQIVAKFFDKVNSAVSIYFDTKIVKGKSEASCQSI